MAIRAFATDHGFADDALAWFLAVMREMDAEYLGMRVPIQGHVIEEVSMTDHQGLRGLLRRLAKPAKREKGRVDANA